MRRQWGDPRFWAWWWRYKLSPDVKWVMAMLAIATLGVGGFTAAAGLSSGAKRSAEPLEGLVTVRRLVTVREKGRIVTQARRIVRTLRGDATTRYETQVLLDTVTWPGRTSVVTQRDVQNVPVFERFVVTRGGRTIVETRPGITLTRTAVVTDQRTVTNERVLTSESVVTRERVVTETLPVTVRSTATTVVTETVPVTVVESVTLPVTVEVPVTVTVTIKK